MQDSSLGWSFNKLKNVLKTQLGLVHLCFFCGGVQSCLICVSFNPFCNPCAWEGEVLFHVHTYRISKACFFAVQKKTRKFFMSFCFCVIVNPSCLQSSELALTTVNFSRIFFENASCKRLVLALVGFGLASFKTRFKNTHEYMHTHTHKIFADGLCITRILRDGNSTFLSWK